MLILLPPSEGKRRPDAGVPLRLDALSWPELTPRRRSLLTSLARTSAQPDAAARLGAPAGAAGDITANVNLATAPCAPAAQIYSGVLYAALDHARLDADAQSRAEASVVIFSALFGMLRLSDAIPAYRASACSRLDGVAGSLGAAWRRELVGLLPAGRLVVDCRSGSYAAMAKLPGALGVRVFTVREGRRTPVSHWAKQARGHVARALVSAERAPASLDEVVDVVRAYAAAHSFVTATGIPLDMDASGSAGRDALEIITR